VPAGGHTGAASEPRPNATAGSASRPPTPAGSAGAAAPLGRAAQPRQPFAAAPAPNAVSPTPDSFRPAPAFTRPMPTAHDPAPPASVEETLRSIAENAARWTDLAGVSLARSSSAEAGKGVAAANATQSFDVEKSAGDAASVEPVRMVSRTSAHDSLGEVVERASGHPSGHAPAVSA